MSKNDNRDSIYSAELFLKLNNLIKKELLSHCRLGNTDEKDIFQNFISNHMVFSIQIAAYSITAMDEFINKSKEEIYEQFCSNLKEILKIKTHQ